MEKADLGLLEGSNGMTDSDNILKKRFRELAERSYSRNIFMFTDFLSLAEQSLLTSCMSSADFPKVRCELYGGNEACERRIARFGDEETNGYTVDYPISCVTISPKNGKFSDDLSHRDFLGSIMSLGIKREMTGDIFIHENTGYLFCTEKMAEYISENLTSIKRTSVICTVSKECPAEIVQKTKELDINTGSERVDAVLCAVYHLSRGNGAKLFDTQRVFINSHLVLNQGTALREDDVVSVRGFGKFKYCGVQKMTKKVRLFVRVEIYGN